MIEVPLVIGIAQYALMQVAIGLFYVNLTAVSIALVIRPQDWPKPPVAQEKP